jgi:hypothetical protein
MSRDSGARRRWWRHLQPDFLLILANCSQLPPPSSVAIPPIPAGEAFKRLASGASASEKADLFAGTASRFYRLGN